MTWQLVDNDYQAVRTLFRRQPWQRPEPGSWGEFLITTLAELYLEDGPGRDQSLVASGYF
jgi:hypothetical protein